MTFDQLRGRVIKYIQTNWFTHEQVQYYAADKKKDRKNASSLSFSFDAVLNSIKVHIDMAKCLLDALEFPTDK